MTELEDIYWALVKVGSSGQLTGKTEETFLKALGDLWEMVPPAPAQGQPDCPDCYAADWDTTGEGFLRCGKCGKVFGVDDPLPPAPAPASGQPRSRERRCIDCCNFTTNGQCIGQPCRDLEHWEPREGGR